MCSDRGIDLSMGRGPKVVIIGIDGATFSLIEPWAVDGKLPVLARLMQNGAWGNLDSTIPPMTAPAWTSFMTGKNPGKHGLFHFISPRPDSYEFIYTNAGTRKARTIWSLLSEKGKRSGVVNVPMTFPPERINGFMISGMDTPDENSEFIYPTSLRDKLKKDFGEVRLEMRHLEFMRSDDKREMVLKEMADIEDHRKKLAIHLIKNYPVDVFMLVFCSVDQIQHYFWHNMDTNHYRYDETGARKYGDAILKAYQTIDNKLGEILAELPEDAVTVLMSDHGAGPSGNTVINLNNYLSSLGVLTFKGKGKGSVLGSIVKKIDPLLRKTLTPRQKAKIANLFPGLRRHWESRLTAFETIDLSKTKAFNYEILPTYTNVFVNLKGKFPQGIVNPGAEYDELIDFIIEKLYDLEDPETGKKVVKKIYKKEEVYFGPHSEMAPDILMSWWEDEGFTIRPGQEGQDDVFVRKLGSGFDSLVNWSGTHRRPGIFLFHGEPFKKLRLDDGVNIVDLAPTLLYLLGCPIPEDMDGKVITAAFKDDYLQGNPVRYESVSDPGSHADDKNEQYSDDEADLVAKRLRALGYIE